MQKYQLNYTYAGIEKIGIICGEIPYFRLYVIYSDNIQSRKVGGFRKNTGNII